MCEIPIRCGNMFNLNHLTRFERNIPKLRKNYFKKINFFPLEIEFRHLCFEKKFQIQL